MGTDSTDTVQRVAHLADDGGFDDLTGSGGPVARTRSVTELGGTCDTAPAVPATAELLSLRNAPTLRGGSLIDDVALGDLLANMATQPPAVRGRPNVLADGRVGKFGWKADVPSLVEFMALAFRNEMGMTSLLEPRDEVGVCAANANSPEIDALALQGAAKFINTLDPPVPTAACLTGPGVDIFKSLGCAACHTPSLPGPGARQAIPIYSDLLLHDMGPGLADQFLQGSSTGSEWRTTPLWRVSERTKFLHDGRATSLTDAILAHGGQGQVARDAFAALDDRRKQALLAYLGGILLSTWFRKFANVSEPRFQPSAVSRAGLADG